jgi:TonB-dependent receptor
MIYGKQFKERGQSMIKKKVVLHELALIAFVTAFFAASVFSDTNGKIKGMVKDASSGTSLPGANIFLQGTFIGTVTDLNGKYVIPNVPPGMYTIVVTYIGYNKQEIPVNLKISQEVEINLALKLETIRGQEVIVTAQAEGQLHAINQQLTSDKIVNMVSEARIQELPDFNAAQALSRLPSVSTLESSGEANKIVIRGLAPQYNSVAIEGVKLSSTGSTQMGISTLGNTSGNISNDRSVDLSMVSPYMIKSISVFKSLTPDMNANSIGGSVNMELREAPSELHYDVLWQQGYTDKTKYYGNYRSVASVSKRFFEDKLGVYFLGNIEKYDRNDDAMTAGYKTTSSKIDTLTGFRPVSVTNVTLNRHIEIRKRYGGNLILDYKLPSGSIKSVNMYTRLNSDFKDNRTVLNYNDKLLNFNYQEGNKKTDMIMNSLELKNDFKWVLIDLKASRTSSQNSMPESPYLAFKTGQVSNGAVTPNTIPENLLSMWTYPGPQEVYLDNISLWSSLYKESNNTLSSDFKIPFRLGSSLSGNFKIGGMYYHQKNSNDQKAPYANLNKNGDLQVDMVADIENHFNIQVDPSTLKFTGSTFLGDLDLTQPFLNDRFGKIYWVCNPTIPTEIARYLNGNDQWKGRATGGAGQTGGWYRGIFQTLANSYDYFEDYFATYLMSEINYRNLMVVGGTRYEKMSSKYTAYNMYDMRNPDTQIYDTVISKPESEYWLPMIQTKYAPLNWFDLRYAYSQTLARPDYHQMSPKIIYDNPRLNITAGNPNLKPAHAYNHDLNLTFHGNKLGLFSVGGFYKTIDDFTYNSSYILHKTAVSPGIKTIYDFNIGGVIPADGARLNTFINSLYPAYVKGLEFDFQTRLWYLPYGLDGIVLGINYSKMESNAKYPLRDDVTDYTKRPPVTTTYDSTRAGRLIYQPNDLLNAYIGYDLKGFSARVSFLFQGNSVSFLGTFPEQDGYTKDYFRIDATIRQTLPYWGMEVYLDINNINNEKNQSAQMSIDGFTNVKHYGLTANLGIRIKK